MNIISWLRTFIWERPGEISNELQHKTPTPIVSIRKDASQADWDEETGTALVTLRKGKIWNNTGITRSKSLLCHLEETAFLMERGYLVLRNKEKLLTLHEVLQYITDERYGFTLDCYQVYSHLKTLGYIISRHGVSWSEKAEVSHQGGLNSRLIFDVYSPNSRFKKTNPGPPMFSICVSRKLPTRHDVKELERESEVPVKFAIVNGGNVGIFSFETVELPCLP